MSQKLILHVKEQKMKLDSRKDYRDNSEFLDKWNRKRLQRLNMEYRQHTEMMKHEDHQSFSCQDIEIIQSRTFDEDTAEEVSIENSDYEEKWKESTVQYMDEKTREYFFEAKWGESLIQLLSDDLTFDQLEWEELSMQDSLESMSERFDESEWGELQVMEHGEERPYQTHAVEVYLPEATSLNKDFLQNITLSYCFKSNR
mmetsp:Transcript_4736/g.6128  ORF Transcript_4736/g.6128 Transcript_4736/m.6128 type:complete len:200 (+) Transcript_4736:129-728(+)